MTETAYETLPELESSETRIGASTVVMKFGGTSVADPEKLMTSPTLQVVPAPGALITAVGAVLPPTEIVMLWSSVAPARSVTRSVAVTVPAEV